MDLNGIGIGNSYYRLDGTEELPDNKGAKGKEKAEKEEKIEVAEEECPVCYEEIKAPKIKKILENCKHVFCQACVDYWAQHARNLSENPDPSCPLCRKDYKSDYKPTSLSAFDVLSTQVSEQSQLILMQLISNLETNLFINPTILTIDEMYGPLNPIRPEASQLILANIVNATFNPVIPQLSPALHLNDDAQQIQGAQVQLTDIFMRVLEAIEEVSIASNIGGVIGSEETRASRAHLESLLTYLREGEVGTMFRAVLENVIGNVELRRPETEASLNFLQFLLENLRDSNRVLILPGMEVVSQLRLVLGNMSRHNTETTNEEIQVEVEEIQVEVEAGLEDDMRARIAAFTPSLLRTPINLIQTFDSSYTGILPQGELSNQQPSYMEEVD